MSLRFGLALAAAWLGGCGSPPAPPAGETRALDAELIALNNRGVGLMGYFDYEAAHAAFAEVTARAPDWLDARVNLAIATLNRQGQGDEQRALAELAAVINAEPGHLRALYMSGLLRLYLGESERARDLFLAVAERDPRDAYAAYYLGQTQLQLERYADAVQWFERAIELDPYLRSAYYGASLALRRLGDRDRADEMVAAFQRFEHNPRATLAEFKYTRMGPKGDALATARDTRPAADPPAGPLFAARQRLVSAAGPVFSLSTADVDDDGRQDLFLAGGKQGPTLLMHGRGADFEAAPGHPLSGIERVNAAAWGDMDNDGLLDVYLCRAGANQLWRQHPAGQWQEIASASGTANGTAACSDAVLFDADHDGDLDIFVVNADAANELLNNDLDGTFRPLGASQGIDGGARASRGVVVTDLDGDRDVDIVVVHAEPPHEIFVNDRLWQYRPALGFDALASSDLRAVVAGDVDTDGRVELYAMHGDGLLRRWSADDRGEWSAATLQSVGAPGPALQLALADFSGDATLELMIADRGLKVLELTSTGAARARFAEELATAGVIAVLLDPAAGPALVGAGDGELYLWPPGPGRYEFAALALSGREDAGDSMRSNASAIGTRLGVRIGTHWTVLDTFDHHSGPGQSLQPLAVGLRGQPSIDYVAIDWPDGVFQTELALASGSVTAIAETQRQLASCPVLFAWDGEGYRFVTDLLGVGGLGFFVEPGSYGEPRPFEHLALPPGVLQPKEGRYSLRLTEPMEEIAYLDSVRLRQFDLPPGWSMVLDERFAINGPAPTGVPLFYRTQREAVRAYNERGEDVSGALAAADRLAAPPGALDRRFIGRLANEHVLTLEFDAPIVEGPGAPVLAIDGWVEYPYSQTMFAAWQAGARYAAPTLEYASGDGPWQLLVAELGYPAGMPREMSYPLAGLPADATRLRLRTTQEVYWDRLRVVYAEKPPQLRERVLEPSKVRLAFAGFPTRTDGPQRVPDYDYERRSTFWDTRYPAGYYTTFGDVTALAAERDDAFVIIGPGEEAQLEFAAPDAPPPTGWTRRLVLETYGYAKDMDLYTRDGDTVGPLPVRLPGAQAQARRDALHARYHLRYLAGK